MKELDKKDDEISKLTQELSQEKKMSEEKEQQYKSAAADGKKAMAEVTEANRYK